MNNKLYEDFVKQLKSKITNQDKELLFLCIGTNKIIGDSLGPMVGSKLRKLNVNKKIDILGNMKEPMCGRNISRKFKEIKKYQSERYIIAIDSAISNDQNNIGEIFISNKSMILGSGINKNILQIGDISIKGVVCENFRELEKVPEKRINQLSSIVANAIHDVVFN